MIMIQTLIIFHNIIDCEWVDVIVFIVDNEIAEAPAFNFAQISFGKGRITLLTISCHDAATAGFKYSLYLLFRKHAAKGWVIHAPKIRKIRSGISATVYWFRLLCATDRHQSNKKPVFCNLLWSTYLLGSIWKSPDDSLQWPYTKRI